MTSVFNFSPGPAALPPAVMQQVREELLDWQHTGTSVMEVSHRSKPFLAVAETAEADLRTLLAIPDDYRVLFLQGGATAQFAMVPMNLLGHRGTADYINTGAWSRKAIGEARRFAKVNVAASSEADGYTHIPSRDGWRCDPDAAYLHYTPNETIDGVEFHWIPDAGDVPLVADMSSTILSRPVDVSRFGVIYAGAQKNVGPAGLTIVIVRDDLLDREPLPLTPSLMSYATQAESGSMANTPPTFAWYVAGLVFRWLLASGGLEEMARVNERKARTLYSVIDASDFYTNRVAADDRSWMNVPFTLAKPELDKVFLAQAEEAGLLALKGHRSVGGMRASLYNAMPQEGVEALVAFMADFERQHG